MTDGILLKEISNDFMLSRYSVILLDEAHERTVHTDILIGLLSRIVPLRRKKAMIPLKLVIMSATLRIDDFVNNDKLFPTVKPPVLKIESRQFPVTTTFARKTELDDYIGAAYRKVCKVHREEGQGAILVFVTGQDEVKRLVARLGATFPREMKKETEKLIDLDSIDPTNVTKSVKVEKEDVYHGDEDDDEFGEVDFSEETNDDDETVTTTGLDSTLPMLPLPLYSVLHPDEQKKIFLPSGEGVRKVIIATNVAETSLTIPGVKYVIDTGRYKERVYSEATGIQKFEIKWISQAAADQRAGRAGRTGPGKCYRLFSSAVYQDFVAYPAAEIAQRPLDDLVLDMKHFGIDHIRNFPFVTAPDSAQLTSAERLLIKLGALEPYQGRQPKQKSKMNISGQITQLGETMHAFPVAPRFARILSLAQQKGLLPYAIAVVAACTVRELIDDSNVKMAQLKEVWCAKNETHRALGDLLVLLSALGATENAKTPLDFATKIGIRIAGLKEVRKLRRLIVHAVNRLQAGADDEVPLERKLPRPNEEQIRLLTELFVTGFGDQIARRNGTSDQYNITSMTDEVKIHPHSALAKSLPEWVCYQTIEENQKGNVYLRQCMALTPSQIVAVAPVYLAFTRDRRTAPEYDHDFGHVRAPYQVTYSSWSLGTHMRRVTDDNEVMLRCLTAALLEGQVVTGFGELRKHYLSPPAVLLRPWSTLHQRTTVLIKVCSQLGIDSKERLIDQVKNSRAELEGALRLWLPKEEWPVLARVLTNVE